MRVALAQINPIIGSFVYNRDKIIAHIKEAREKGAQIVLFPEMALCGYPPEDLLLMPSFIEEVERELKLIIEASSDIAVVVGTVRPTPAGMEKGLFNSAAIIENKKLLGFQDKMLLPAYDVFSEKRYFEPASQCKIWEIAGKKVGVTICEDIWQHAKAVEYSDYPRDPIEELKDQKPELLLNISASPFYLKRHDIRLKVCRAAAKTLACPLLYCNQVGGNDSLIFDGYSLYLDASGNVLQHAKGFVEELLIVDTEENFSPIFSALEPEEDLFHALVLGIRDYFQKQGFSKACIGLSGGIDSAVVAYLAVTALGAENVLMLAMPSRYSSEESAVDAKQLSQNLGTKMEWLSIEEPFTAFLNLLEPHFVGKKSDVTEENLQARIRGILLMAFSNKFGYLVLGTGNKSEMAMGYSTLYGDMCGGLGVLSDVTKKQVYALARWFNRKEEIIPQRIIDKPPSAELRPDQKDQDTLPEYAIIDRVLEEYVEDHLSPEEIAEKENFPLPLVKELVRKIHLSEYKRRQAPPGLRVTRKAFSIGRRFPIVQHWNVR